MLFISHFFHLLSATATIGGGFLWSVALFLFCFIGVHAMRFLQKLPPNVEKRLTKEKPSQEKEKQTQQSAEPVYYLVERKPRRKKTRYSDAKEIRFQ